MWHPLVQTNSANGRRSLLIGAHPSQVIDWPLDEGRALLQDLLQRATTQPAIDSHQWSDSDVVIWDNRAALHRATAYDAARHRWLMQRTTIGNPDFLVDLHALAKSEQLTRPQRPRWASAWQRAWWVVRASPRMIACLARRESASHAVPERASDPLKAGTNLFSDPIFLSENFTRAGRPTR